MGSGTKSTITPSSDAAGFPFSGPQSTEPIISRNTKKVNPADQARYDDLRNILAERRRIENSPAEVVDNTEAQIKRYRDKYGDDFYEKMPSDLQERYETLLEKQPRDNTGRYTDPITGEKWIDEGNKTSRANEGQNGVETSRIGADLEQNGGIRQQNGINPIRENGIQSTQLSRQQLTDLLARANNGDLEAKRILEQYGYEPENQEEQTGWRPKTVEEVIKPEEVVEKSQDTENQNLVKGKNANELGKSLTDLIDKAVDNTTRYVGGNQEMGAIRQELQHDIWIKATDSLEKQGIFKDFEEGKISEEQYQKAIENAINASAREVLNAAEIKRLEQSALQNEGVETPNMVRVEGEKVTSETEQRTNTAPTNEMTDIEPMLAQREIPQNAMSDTRFSDVLANMGSENEKTTFGKRLMDNAKALNDVLTGKNRLQPAYASIDGDLIKADNTKSINDIDTTKVLFSKKIANDGTGYVELDGKLAKNNDGTTKTPREMYNSLIGKTLVLDDGTQVEIVKKLKNIVEKNKPKDMFNELSKRWPRSRGVADISTINSKVNGNLDEVIETSKLLTTKPDAEGRHAQYGVKDFDTREVNLYDPTDRKAYTLTLSIANLDNGQKVGYAKKLITPNDVLAQTIEKGTPVTSALAEQVGKESRKGIPNSSIAENTENVNPKTRNQFDTNNFNVIFDESLGKNNRRAMEMNNSDTVDKINDRIKRYAYNLDDALDNTNYEVIYEDSGQSEASYLAIQNKETGDPDDYYEIRIADHTHDASYDTALDHTYLWSEYKDLDGLMRAIHKDLQNRYPNIKELQSNTPTQETRVSEQQGSNTQVPENINPNAQSRFAQNTATNRNFSDETRKALKTDPVGYKPVTNEERLARANEILSTKSIDEIDNYLRDNYFNVKDKDRNSGDTVLAGEFAKQLDARGQYDRSTEIINKMSKIASKQGQEIQALAMMMNRSPEGIANMAQSAIKKGGGEMTGELRKQIVEKTQEIGRIRGKIW